MSRRVFTLLNVWSEQNKGDFAIVVSTLQYLRDKYGLSKKDKVNIVFIGITQEAIQTLIKEKQIVELAKYNLIGAPIPFLTQQNGKLVGLSKFHKIKNIVKGIWELSFKKSKLFKVLSKSDFIISVGGHYLFSFDPDNVIKEFLSLFTLTYPYQVANELNKKLNLFGVSIGPYYHKISLWYLKKVLKGHKIFVREKFSQQFLKEKLNINSQVIPDVAFYLELDKPRFLNINKEVRIGITIRDWPFPEVEPALREQKKFEYKRAIAEFCKKAVAKYNGKIKITFYPQVCISSKGEDDRKIMKEVEGMLDSDTKKHVDFWYHQPKLEELVRAYHDMHVMIGTRMHSLILGIPTPFIAIAYMGKKTHGLIKWLDYPNNLLVDISNINAGILLKQLDYVLANRKVLFEHLKKKKQEFKELIKNVELVKA